ALQRLDRKRGRIQIALREGTAEIAQQRRLFDRLDALGDETQAEIYGEAGDRAHDRAVAEIGGDVAHEAAIDLERVERRRRERVERRVAGAEVVDHQRHAQRLEVLQSRLRLVAAAAEDRLGDLERQLARLESDAFDGLAQVAD